ncbi:MAG: YdcH family protein [Thioalkalivibrio sp.]
MDEIDCENIKQRLTELRVEHRDLDEATARLAEGVFVDQLQLNRLKKRKLQIKDMITRLESRLIPDLNA